MSAELDALLDAIRANPEDDLPRLALADWCSEQPDEAEQARGEFIHLRCRGATLPADDPEHRRMEGRARQLRTAFELRWLHGLDKLVPGWDFERGCLLLEVTSGSLKRNPFAKIAVAPGWRWVIGIRGLLLTPRDVGRIVGSPLLAHLTSLDLRDSEVGASGATILARSAHVQHLASLEMGYCALGNEGVSALATSPHLARLTTLMLCNNSITKDGAADLAHGANLGRLVRLDLSRNPLGDVGARELAGTALSSLRELSLAWCKIGNRGGVLLASSSALEKLSLLDLRDNRFDDATAAELRERFGKRVRL